MESDLGDWVVIDEPSRPRLATDDNGRSALQAARDGEDLPTISRLVRLEKDKFWGLYPYSESRSLAVAAQDGDLRVVNLLLAAGDDFNGIVSDFCSSALENAAAGGHYEVVKRLLEVEREVTTAEGYFDPEILDAAVENDQHEEVYRLKQNLRLLDRNQKHRDVALKVASGQKDLRIVEALVEAGAVANSNNYAFERHPSALTAAAGAGHLHTVHYLLLHGASVDPIQTGNKRTPLRAAAEGGHTEVIERLLLEGADVNADKALHEAARNGHIDIVRRLLEGGALVDAEKKNATLWNTLDQPWLPEGEFTALQGAAKEGHLKIVELLLQEGADVNVPPSDWGRTALQAAAEGGFVETVKALVAAGADVNASGFKGGLTALQAGVKNESLEVINILLNNGAVLETEVQERGSKSALVMAAEQGSLDIFKRFLLHVGAPGSLKGKVTTSLCVKALNHATEKAHREVVRHLLAFGTPAIRDKESSHALLLSAVNGGDIELLKILLERQANLEDKCFHYGRPQPTALQAAVEHERLDMAELLIKEGANVNGGEGATPPALHIASKNGNLPLVKLLLNAGADVNARDYEGSTTLQAGEIGGNQEVLMLLQMRQAEVPASLAAATNEDAGSIEKTLELPDTEGKPLCTTCGPRLFNVFETSRTLASKTFDWHPSLTALDASAKTGCPFCVFFKKQLGNTVPIPQPSLVCLRHEYGADESIWSDIREPYPKNSQVCRRTSTNFHFVTEPFEGKRKPVPGSTSSPETFAQIRSWLTSCDSGHKKCQSCSTPGFQPTRLIDLGISKDQETVRLIDTVNASLENPKYITLSYCDGEQPMPSSMTTEASLRSHHDSIPIGHLPLTFVHAIEIAKNLHIQYLWINNLCIIQDSEEDRDRESHLISQVYMNAYCTIAAAQSEDNTGGIFRTLPSKEYSKVEFECTSAKGERKKVLAFKATPMRWRSMQEKFPLNKRTWAFLELELSPRVLYFTGSQVLWECGTLRAMESWPTDNMPKEWPHYPTPPRLLNWLLDPGDLPIYDFWHQAVTDFTARQVKEYCEILVIVACLARALGSRIEGKYIAGILEKDLRRSLAWHPIHYNPIHYIGGPRQRHPKYLAPSWSWASVNGPVRFDARPRQSPSLALAHEDGALQILSHSLSLSPAAKDEFGPLLTAELRISTPIIKAVFGYDPKERAYGNVIHLKDSSGTKSYGEMSFDVLTERGDLKIVSCVYLFKQNGMSILPVEGRDGYYRRVGAITGIPLEHFQNKEWVEITLI